MMIVVTGGSGSGKSAYAESRICRLYEEIKESGKEAGKLLYIATMIPYGQESLDRIERHRKMRASKGFQTLECYRDLESLEIEPGSCVLLECMSNLAANEMFQEGKERADIACKIMDGVARLKKPAAHLCIVTNEIFSEGGNYQGDTRRYQKELGKINGALAEMADEVTEVVYGIPVRQKGTENESFME